MRPVLVFGHRNPDNDSICSAVAYAHLKNVTDKDGVYVPARLGPMPPEASWVFERFGVEAPEQIPHVRLRARDIMAQELVTTSPDDSLLVAGTLMRENDIRSLPVVLDGRAVGMVTMSTLAGRYVEDVTCKGFGERSVTVERLAAVLDGELVTGDPTAELTGDVLIGAMEPDTMRGYIKPGDTLIVGDRQRTQPLALDAGVACLVLTGGFRPSDEVASHAKERGAAIVVTEHDSFGAARLIDLSDPVTAVTATDVLRVTPGTLLSEVAEDLFESPHREAVVEDDEGRLVGLITRSSIATAEPRRVILVDHNEVSQSADGIEDASVAEVVDHHRIGDVQTDGPVLFMNMPLGSTATVVAEAYRQRGIDVPDQIAGLMLAAVLTDTVLLKSPTTTDVDREVAGRLARQLALDVTEFGMDVFKARSIGHAFDVSTAVTADLKEYRLGEAVIGVGQVETVDLEQVMSHREDIATFMDSYRETRGLDLLLLMVTDVVREGSEMLASGRTRIAEKAFGIEFAGGSAWLPGVLSRKKQVAAKLAEVAGR